MKSIRSILRVVYSFIQFTYRKIVKQKKELSFTEKVQSMSAKEIIMAMVQGLRDPKVRVNMSYFGGSANDICYGCAATNTICEISGKVFTPYNINNTLQRSEFIGVDFDFLKCFEHAINYLRIANLYEYNRVALAIGIATIEYTTINVPVLHNDYTSEQLDQYVELANSQKEIKL